MTPKEFYESLQEKKPFTKLTNTGISDNLTNVFEFAKEYEQKQLLLHNVVQAKPEKVCELIRQKFDDWVFGLETQAGEKLKVVDSTDFNDIITEIESGLKDL